MLCLVYGTLLMQPKILRIKLKMTQSKLQRQKDKLESSSPIIDATLLFLSLS